MRDVQVGEEVTFVKSNGQGGKVELKAKVLVVWSKQCVNLDVEDGTKPTSVLRVDYFPTLPAGHYWKF